MKRFEAWETRYHEFLQGRHAMPFVWGSNDCALFAADGILAITGTDIAKRFRVQYKTERGAFGTIRRVTKGSTVEDAVAWCAAKAGMIELVHPLLAARGDLVIVEDGGRTISGLVHLSARHVVAVGEDGLKRLCITKIKRAWRV